MTLTQEDLLAIKNLIRGEVESVLEEKLVAKLKPIYEFIDFAKTALLSLLDESQEHFEQKLPERIRKLEEIHPAGSHVN